VERSLETFTKFFELLLSTRNAPRHALIAFDLTQYVCERLQPDFGTVKHWLERLLTARGADEKALPPGPFPRIYLIRRRGQIRSSVCGGKTLEISSLYWWAHKDSNLGPAD
jgi:hypothetical protein